MSDVETTQAEGETAEAAQPDVTPEDMITRGVGLRLEAIEDGSPAATAVEQFRQLQERFRAAEQSLEDVKQERLQAIYDLKSKHNVGFTAIAELIGGTSSLALYLYERAQGKTAKQIREESQRSAAAKARFQETDPNKKSARKQTPEEKAFRKQQREALAAFLAEQRAAAGEDPDGADADADEPDEDE
jgi:hypothetical protein